MRIMHSKLKPSESRFVREYRKPGSNKTKAYLKVNPDVTRGSASTLGGRMLKKVEVQKAIERAEDREDCKDVGSRAYLLQEAHEVGLAASQDGQHRTRIAAIDTKAKLSGAYSQDAPDLEGYGKLLQGLFKGATINVNTPQTSEDEHGEVIEVEGMDDMGGAGAGQSDPTDR